MKKLILLTFASLLFMGCKENSPLSDVELINPALISPEITLSKHENELGRTNTSVKIYLNDKNNNSINLLKGGVELNKKPLGVHTEIGGAPYYSLDHIELVPKRKYQFDIKMADDEVYSCSVNSPEKHIGELHVPQYHDRNVPLVVSWDNINNDATKCLIEVKSDFGSEEIILSTSQVKAGSCFISPELFNLINKGNKGNDFLITLSSINYGTVDPQFNGGSIKIIESICRQVTLGEGRSVTNNENGYETYNPK